MGLILNNNVEETKIMSAYGLTVYGKINRYVWTISDRAEENALITIRIADAEGNDIFSMNMGNNVILQSRIDDTMDNFYTGLQRISRMYTTLKSKYSSRYVLVIVYSIILLDNANRTKNARKKKHNGLQNDKQKRRKT